MVQGKVTGPGALEPLMRSMRSLREAYVWPTSNESMQVYWIFDAVPTLKELETLKLVEDAAMAEQPRKGFTFTMRTVVKNKKADEIVPEGVMRAWVRPGYRG